MTTIYTFAQSAIEDARSAGRYGTANLYTSAINSFRKFTGDIPLTFKELTAGLIKTYEESLLQQGRRHNTISAYMRMLRSIFNQAHLQGIPDAISADELFRFVFTGYEPTAKRAISPTLIRRLSQLNLEKHPNLRFSRDLFLLSFTSRIVLAADSEGRYSHTGILKKERGAWYVIHAVPGEPDFKGDADRIKMEPVERFFDAGKAARGAVMHVQADSALACRAARSALGLFRKHLLFDHDYDLNDTTEMYCTELIDYVYRKEGIDLSEGRTTSVNIPGMSGDYLMPNDIAQSGRLCLIYCF